MVEARAHVRITRFSRVVFSLAIFWARFWSMNGPFLSERLTYRSSSSRAALVRCSLPTTATPHPTKSSIPGVPTKPASWGGSRGPRGLQHGRLDQGFALPLLLTPRNLRFRGDPEACHTGGSIKASHYRYSSPHEIFDSAGTPRPAIRAARSRLRTTATPHPT